MKTQEKKVLQKASSIKIIVRRVYSEEKQLEKTFAEYLCHQIDRKGA